jgi:hypothetical protein
MLFIHVTKLEPEPEKRPPGGPDDGREEYEFSPQERGADEVPASCAV